MIPREADPRKTGFHRKVVVAEVMTVVEVVVVVVLAVAPDGHIEGALEIRWNSPQGTFRRWFRGGLSRGFGELAGGEETKVGNNSSQWRKRFGISLFSLPA